MSVDTRSFRQALGRFPTGVTVVTGRRSDGLPTGVTVSAFSSVSLDPPLVLICLDRSTAFLEAYGEARHFAVHVLKDDQEGLALAFATSREEKFADLAVAEGEGGCPLIAGCLAWIECLGETVHAGGDHVIIVGRVLRVGWAEKGRPLLHFRGTFVPFGGGS